MRVRVTEYLDLAIPERRWSCNRCGRDLGPAERPYKEGCLIANRDPREVHPVLAADEEFNFSFDPEWVRLVEFYCPGCGTMVENEYLPPGHPLTWDIDLDLDAFERTHREVPEDTTSPTVP
ncbi:MAG: hypothetical protein JWQ99_2427 [Blastococcus sp.]|jgi:acetone carboxylase gamma subunit|nr:hypothetical protein [Blastococcus sp.]